MGFVETGRRHSIGSRLMEIAHQLAGGEKDIAVYLIANEKAIPFYKKLGMKKAEDVMRILGLTASPAPDTGGPEVGRQRYDRLDFIEREKRDRRLTCLRDGTTQCVDII